MKTFTISPDDYTTFRDLLKEISGIVLGDNKHYLVSSRLNRVMADHSIESFNDLLAKMKKDMRLQQIIMDAMTTNETSWFRDNYPFDVLKDKIYPEFAKLKLTNIKIWSAACSSGQEPYSVSMAATEYLQSRPGSLPAESIQITGTDISPSMLSLAKEGLYESSAIGRGLSDERKKRFFTEHGDLWRVANDVRKRVTIRELNLMQSYASIGSCDVIFCRNVLIYFSPELKIDIMNRLAKSLKPHGYLILGGSESVSGYSDAFELVRWKNGVIYSLKNNSGK